MAKIEKGTGDEVRKIVYEFFSEECDVPVGELRDTTDIFKDLEGDSLMLAELLEIITKRFGLDVDLKAVGAYAVKHPAETIGAIIDLNMLIIEYENRIAGLS